MLQRLIAALLGVLGIAAIGLGVASATVWRADDPLVATADPGGDTRTLVTDPGVLELAGDPVTVTVRAEGSPVVLAVGRDTDVTAWVGSDPYARVTGLSDWHTLATTAGEPPATATPTATATAEAEAEPAPSPSASGASEEAAVEAADPTGSDMWVLEVGGDGSATVDWPAQDGRWSLIAVSLGDTAPTLDLSWPQTVTTPWLWPAVAFGVLLLAVAAILLVRILRAPDGPDAGWHPVTTGAIATVTAPPGSLAAGGAEPSASGAIPLGTVGVSAPTRRQIREAEAAAAAAAAAERRRGRRTPTGSIPAVTGATPVVTGATPVATGATPAVTGATQAAAASTAAGTGPTSAARAADRPAGERAATSAAPSAPATPATQGTPKAGTQAPATAPTSSVAPPTPGAPSGEQGAPENDVPEEPRRGLAARLPWRKGRAGQDAAPAASSGPAEPATSPSTPGSSSATTSWSPTPAASAAPQAPAPARPGTTATPRGTAPVPPAAGAPSASAAGAAAPVPGARPVADDDAASRAQRADAWRRMWGFPAEGGGPDAAQGDAAREDDARTTEEDR